MDDRKTVLLVQSWIKMSLGRPKEEIFGAVIDRIETHGSYCASDRKIASVASLKDKTTKAKGDLWEAFCYLYLSACNKNNIVYFLDSLPRETRKRLRLPSQDIGIDLVIVRLPSSTSPDVSYEAVQCKYRHTSTKGGRRTYVKYADLATFIALCSRTGPWAKKHVMTNCHGASWKGLKSKDGDETTLTKTLFENLSRSTWVAMSRVIPASISPAPETNGIVSAEGLNVLSEHHKTVARKSLRDEMAKRFEALSGHAKK